MFILPFKHIAMVTVILSGQNGNGILFNVGGQTGKDCLLTWADGVKVTDRRDRTRNLSLHKRLRRVNPRSAGEKASRRENVGLYCHNVLGLK